MWVIGLIFNQFPLSPIKDLLKSDKIQENQDFDLKDNVPEKEVEEVKIPKISEHGINERI